MLTAKRRTLATRAEQALFALRDRLDQTQPPGSPSVVASLETSIHPDWSGLWVEIAPHAREHLAIDDFVREWRQRIGEIGRAKIDFIYKQGDRPYDLEIDLSDADSSRLGQAVGELKRKLVAYPGVFDVIDSSEPGKPELRVRLKPEGERLRLTLKEVADQVRGAYFGEEVQRFVRGREEVKIMVRLPMDERRSLDTLMALPVKLPAGAHVPFGSVADISFAPGQAHIDREHRRPVLKVQARVDRRQADVNAIYADLERTHLPILLQRFPQLRAEFGQERREQQAALSSLWCNSLIALVVIYALIAVPFRSYVTPLIFLLAAPVAWWGGVLAHWLVGLPMSMESLVGMIAASGVVVNDSAVLLDYIKKREAGGLEESSKVRWAPLGETVRVAHPADSMVESTDLLLAVSRSEDVPKAPSSSLQPHISSLILEACTARFRPILLAFLTTFVGFLPTLLETSAQAQFLIPMTLSLAAGLLFGMAASLVLTPVCYAIVSRGVTRTLGFHYGKHHKGCGDKLNTMIAGTPFADMSLEAIVATTADKPDQTALYDIAAQVWNHTFYWRSMKPKGGGQPPAALKQKIEASFGSVDACKKELATAAITQFGSGWAWLVQEGSALKVLKTANAQTLMSPSVRPLLTLDVWEHAYYLDYQNRRGDYVAAVIDQLLNWGFAADNLQAG